MQQGWITLNRSIVDHWLHKDKPFCRFAAWIDLILMANHEEKKLSVGGKLITIERGQLFTSSVSLSERWGWSRGKVQRFLECLESDQMLIQKRTANGQVLTLVNYGFYQDGGHKTNSKRTANGQRTDSKRTADGHQTDTNNNVNNDNNVNNEKKDIYTSAITEILNYLNLKTGKKYTGRSKAQREHIIARLKEGYTVDEFKTVVDNKVKAWGHDDKMRQYLRPETLFSTKFETYLNDTETERQRARREDHESDEKQREAIRRAGTVEIGYRE